MRKDCLENFLLTRYIEDKSDRTYRKEKGMGKAVDAYLMLWCECLVERRTARLAK